MASHSNEIDQLIASVVSTGLISNSHVEVFRESLAKSLSRLKGISQSFLDLVFFEIVKEVKQQNSPLSSEALSKICNRVRMRIVRELKVERLTAVETRRQDIESSNRRRALNRSRIETLYGKCTADEQRVVKELLDGKTKHGIRESLELSRRSFERIIQSLKEKLTLEEP